MQTKTPGDRGLAACKSFQANCMKETVLIVEDQFIEANNLEMILVRAGYRVCGIARSVPVALEILTTDTPDIVLLDIFLQGPSTGIDLAKILRGRGIAFVYLSANSNKQTLDAAKATKPYGFLVKPFREKDVLVMLEIARYLHSNGIESIKRNADRDTAAQKNTTVGQKEKFTGIVGHNKHLRTVLEHLQIVAPTDTSVLILGETGTGKERIAETIHALSLRRNMPLVKVNCAALPLTLIESILFGHEKGAFTGAGERRIGKFEQANGGTIFLDEIGEMPVDTQVKLLRVLQEKEVERLGGQTAIKINVRVVAATNRDLEQDVADRKFRMDLYYRLNVFPLTLPPLRDRRDDIPILANHFLEHYCEKTGKPVMQISADALSQLAAYAWPGNIRELEHTIERAVLLEKGKVIKQVYLPQDKKGGIPKAGKVKTMEENEKDHIREILSKCNGKVFGKGGAAELLGMNASTLNSRIRKLGIIKSTQIS